MKTAIPLVILIIISVLIWILVFINAKSRNKKVRECFTQIAEKYGLTLNESNIIGSDVYPLVTGIYKRRQIGIGCLASGEGKKKETQTYIRVECPNQKKIEFQVVKKAKSSVALTGGNGVNMMDSEFDEKFMVAGSIPLLIFPLFTFNVKYSLLQALHLGLKGTLTLEDNLLDYTEPGLIYDENSRARIELILHIMCDVADELEKN